MFFPSSSIVRSVLALALVSCLLWAPGSVVFAQSQSATAKPTAGGSADPTKPQDQKAPGSPTPPQDPTKAGASKKGTVPRTTGDVIVTIGKPSIWTLAQAHYLLAQLHNTNSQLEVASPGSLDPNTINRQRIDVLRTMFGVTGEYNQLTGLKNDLTRQRYETNVARQRDIRSLSDQRRNDLYQVIRELTLLQSELGKLQTAQEPDGDLIKAKEDEKRAKEAERDILKEQITALNSEATALSTDMGTTIPNFAGVFDGSSAQAPQPTSPLASLIDKATIDSLLKEAAKGSSQLDASRRLDNYIQMQYELIAKQLTLLRDEVGRDERIVFLELPSSIYTVPKKSDRRVVQIRWKVSDYLIPPPSETSPVAVVPVTTRCFPKDIAESRSETQPVTMVDTSSSIKLLADQLNLNTTKLNSLQITEDSSYLVSAPAIPNVPTQKPPQAPVELRTSQLADETISVIRLYWGDKSGADGLAKEFTVLRKTADKTDAFYEAIRTISAGQTQYVDSTVEPGKEYSYKVRAKNDVGAADSQPVLAKARAKTEWTEVKKTQIRAVDIIPRQSALNVNETHNTSNGLNIAAKVTAFVGLGGKVDYQRQREVYDQFIYQDVFASGYGKGENNFGWTFGALPGSKRIAPGVRTTYAVLVVPANAKKLRLKAWGYAFDQNKPVPEWENPTGEPDREFELEIPGNDTDGFDLKEVEYTPVKSSERTTLVLRGPFFSPQLGILINGVPLRKVVSIAQGTTTQNGGQQVVGEFEYVGSNKIVASFSMGPNYEGTPAITLVTPEKAATINGLDLRVNNHPQTCDSIEMHGLLEPMFSSPLVLERAQLVNTPAQNGTNDVTVNLWGRGFKPHPLITVNGKVIRENSASGAALGPNEMPGTIQQNSTRQFVVTFPKPTEATWEFTLMQKLGQGQDETTLPLQMSKPFTRQVNYEILRYRPKTGKAAAELAVKLDVSAFSSTPTIEVIEADGPKPLPGQLFELSPGELLVTIQPKQDLRLEPIILLLTESQTRAMVSILPPVPPTISGIVNSGAVNKPEGSTEGEYSVVIQGENLEYVARVYFGSMPARILQIAPNALSVTVPKGTEGSVQVRLETNIKYLDRLLTNIGDFSTPNKAMFTYVKPKPVPPKE